MTRAQMKTVTFGVIAVMAASCGGDGPEGGSLDTASDVDQATWTLESDLRIGSVDDERNAFSRVVGILPATDGSAFVLDLEQRAVTRYSAAGEPVTRFGRQGQGPGEFSFPTRIGWWKGADSIWVADGSLGRLSVFSVDGEFGRTIPVEQGGYGPVANRTMTHPLAGGVLGRVLQERGEGDWGPVRVVRPGEGDGPPREIARADRSSDEIPIRASPLGPGSIRDPIADGPLLAFSPDGATVFVVDREAPPTADSAVVRVHATRADGASLWETTLPYQPVMIEEAVRDSVIDWVRGVFEEFGDRSPREIDAILERTFDFPHYYPPVHAVIPADDGALWIVWDRVGGGTEATVIDRAGSRVADVSFPDGRADRLTAIAGDYAWSIDLGDFDVPILRRYRIVRP